MELVWIAQREGRLSSFLLGELKMSASLMNKLKWGTAIQVNDVPCRTNHPIQPGDRITVELAAERAEYPAQDGHLDILYEDAYLLAVDKPAGMLIHPSRSKNEGTLANYVLGYYERTGQRSAFHPITRLDRDTFGIVLLAKNAHVHTLLQNTALRKTYHALTYGGPEEASGIIDAPIARRPLPSLLRYVDASGKSSVTRWQVLDRGEGVCKLALEPVTGRTHQLRVHCAYMGFPVLGDPQYGSQASMAFSEAQGLRHQQLCARELTFVHPILGVPLHLTSRMEVSLEGESYAL